MRYGTQQKYESRGASRLIHIFVDFHNGSITQKNPLTHNLTRYGTQQKYESWGASTLIHIFVDFHNGSIIVMELNTNMNHGVLRG